MSYNRYGNSFQRTTPIVLNLIIINVIVFFAQVLIGGSLSPNSITDQFALHHYKSDVFKPVQIVTHMFIHGGWTHLFFNMFGLWMFGSLMEQTLGPKRFLVLYLACGLAAAFAQMANYAIQFREIDSLLLSPDSQAEYQFMLRQAYTVGASGAIMGILGAFAYLFPNTELIIFPLPIPVKAKYAVAVMAAIDLFGGVYSTGSNIAHFAHLGGLAMGFLLVLIWNKTNKKTFY